MTLNQLAVRVADGSLIAIFKNSKAIITRAQSYANFEDLISSRVILEDRFGLFYSISDEVTEIVRALLNESQNGSHLVTHVSCTELLL